MRNQIKLHRDGKPRLWTGKSRLGKKIVGRYRKILEWAVTIEPGDWIATCEGCNRQVTDIEIYWINEGLSRTTRNYEAGHRKNKTWAVEEVRFTDTRNRWHSAPGGGCAFPKETNEQIEAYYKAWIKQAKQDKLMWDDEKFHARLAKMEQAFASGLSIVDENGQFLPEFDC
jgi:hypothetical protein